jgi:hypothetical protein
MEARQRYQLLGVALIAGGAAVGAMAWFVLDYKPLVALGISSLILGAVSMALARSLSRLSGDASLLMLRAGLDNVSALVEELGLREKALYLPTSLTQGRPRALICFHTNSSRPILSRELDRRLIVSYGLLRIRTRSAFEGISQTAPVCLGAPVGVLPGTAPHPGDGSDGRRVLLSAPPGGAPHRSNGGWSWGGPIACRRLPLG